MSGKWKEKTKKLEKLKPNNRNTWKKRNMKKKKNKKNMKIKTKKQKKRKITLKSVGVLITGWVINNSGKLAYFIVRGCINTIRTLHIYIYKYMYIQNIYIYISI